MIYSVYLPAFAGSLLALFGPVFARRLAPAAATGFLVIIAAISATATAGTLALLSVGGLLNVIPSDRNGITSPTGILDGRDGVSWPVGLLAVVLIGGIIIRLCRSIAEEKRTFTELRALVAEAGEGLLVLQDSQAYAYAAPIGHGTVIVSTGILAGLSNEERRALLAHERAHLAHNHYRYLLAARLACAINPFLGALRSELKLQTERWADENAAEEASRPVTARSLARAALAATHTPPAAMAYTTDHVRERLAALALEPRPSQWSATLPMLVIIGVAGVALLDASNACWNILTTLYP